MQNLPNGLRSCLCSFCAIVGSRIAASGVSFTDSENQNATFARLEELVYAAQGCNSSNSGFRPTIDCFTSRTDNVHCPVTAIGGMCYPSFQFSAVLISVVLVTAAFIIVKWIDVFLQCFDSVGWVIGRVSLPSLK